MRVVPHDGTRVDITLQFSCDGRETVCDRQTHCFVEPDDLVLQQRLGFTMKIAQFSSVGLDVFATLVDFSQWFKGGVADAVGPAAAEVVGEPVSVSHEHQVVGDDDAPAGF